MIKVAILEDDPDIRRMYQAKLLEEGFEVRSTGNGDNGMLIAKDFLPDVILLDVVMPGLSGIDFLTNLRRDKKYDKVKVIILTNLEDAALHESFAMMNISDYLVKVNTTPTQVAEKIRSLTQAS